MKRLMNFAAASIVLLFSSSVLAAGPAKPDVKYINGRPIHKEEFEQMKKFSLEMVESALDQMFGRSEKITWKLNPSFDRTPMLRDLSSADVKSLSSCCVATAHPAFGGLRVTLSLGLPNLKGAKVDIEGVKVLLKGKRLQFKETPTSASFVDSGSVNLDLEPVSQVDFKEAIAKMKGTLTLKVKVPSKISPLAFDYKEVGKSKDGVLLKEAKNGSVRFEGPSAQLADAVIWAQDAEGMNYKSKGSQSDSPDARKAYQDYMKKNWEELPEKIEFKPVLSVETVNYDANAAKFIVQTPKKWAEKKIVLPIKFTDSMAKEVFERPVARKICKLDQAMVNKLTVVGTTRSEAMSSFGQPEVFVKLPSCDNSLFAKGTIDQFRFVGQDKRELKDVEVTSGFISYDTFADERRFAKKGEKGRDASFPELKGVIAKAKYDIPQIEIVRVTKAKPVVGKVKLVVKGKEVKVSYPETGDQYEEPTFGHGLGRVTFFDKSGRQLVEPSSSGMTQAGITTSSYTTEAPVYAAEVVLLKPGFVVEKSIRLSFPPGPKPKATPKPETQPEQDDSAPQEEAPTAE